MPMQSQHANSFFSSRPSRPFRPKLIRFLVHCAVSEENEPFAKPFPTMWEEMMPPGME